MVLRKAIELVGSKFGEDVDAQGNDLLNLDILDTRRVETEKITQDIRKGFTVETHETTGIADGDGFVPIYENVSAAATAQLFVFVQSQSSGARVGTDQLVYVSNKEGTMTKVSSSYKGLSGADITYRTNSGYRVELENTDANNTLDVVVLDIGIRMS